jgi:heat shock protein HslJ
MHLEAYSFRKILIREELYLFIAGSAGPGVRPCYRTFGIGTLGAFRMKRTAGRWNLVIVCTVLIISMFTLGCTGTPEGPGNDTGPGENMTPVNGDPEADAMEISEENIADIMDIEWQWVGLDGADPGSQLQVPDPENYNVAFVEDDLYYFRADCNTGSGEYIIEGSSLTLEPGVMTLVACSEESLDTEYLASLTNVTSAAVEDGQLVLYLQEQDSRMLFRNADEPGE